MSDNRHHSDTTKTVLLSYATKFSGAGLAVGSAALVSTGWFTYETLFGLMDLRADSGALSLYQLMMAGAHGGILLTAIVFGLALITAFLILPAPAMSRAAAERLIKKRDSKRPDLLRGLFALLAACSMVSVFFFITGALGYYVALTVFGAAEKRFEQHCRKPDGECPSYVVKTEKDERRLRAVPIISDGDNIYFIAADRIEVLPREDVKPIRKQWRAAQK